jgi:hypothetical protein
MKYVKKYGNRTAKRHSRESVKCKAIVKSCKKYGLSNSLNGYKDEVLFGGRKVQMIQKRMCLIAVMQILGIV